MSSPRVGQILVAVMSPEGGEVSAAERLCVLAASDLAVSGAALVLVSRAGPESILASTGAPALRLAEAQLATGEGPALDAFRARHPVLEPDLAAAQSGRWPVLAPTLEELGVCADFAFPLQVGAISLGVLELSRDSPGPLDRQRIESALHFAEAATAMLLTPQEQALPQREQSRMERLYSDRAEVHQATGMIAVQEGVLMVEALLLLRAYSFSHARPVHQVAREIVARRLRLDDAPGDSS